MIGKILYWTVTHRQDWLVALIYRYRCPANSISARACCAAGDCGCDNARRYPTPTQRQDT